MEFPDEPGRGRSRIRGGACRPSQQRGTTEDVDDLVLELTEADENWLILNSIAWSEPLAA